LAPEIWVSKLGRKYTEGLRTDAGESKNTGGDHDGVWGKGGWEKICSDSAQYIRDWGMARLLTYKHVHIPDDR